jgi:hypothetical protein
MLHGEIKVNNHEIAKWRAVRQTTDTNEYNDYDVTVDYTDMRGYRFRATFVHSHRYYDGALALTGNIMLECIEHLKAYHPYQDID